MHIAGLTHAPVGRFSCSMVSSSSYLNKSLTWLGSICSLGEVWQQECLAFGLELESWYDVRINLRSLYITVIQFNSDRQRLLAKCYREARCINCGSTPTIIQDDRKLSLVELVRSRMTYLRYQRTIGFNFKFFFVCFCLNLSMWAKIL